MWGATGRRHEMSSRAVAAVATRSALSVVDVMFVGVGVVGEGTLSWMTDTNGVFKVGGVFRNAGFTTMGNVRF